MKTVTAVLALVGFLVVAAPAEAGSLSVWKTTTGEYHMQWASALYANSIIHVYSTSDGTGTIFVEGGQRLFLSDSTGRCTLLAPTKLSCPFQLSLMYARLGAEEDSYTAGGMPWMESEVSGGDGNDTIIGGAGNDDLNGGKGDDFLNGRLGTNDLDGYFGTDTCENGAVYISCETILTP